MSLVVATFSGARRFGKVKSGFGHMSRGSAKEKKDVWKLKRAAGCAREGMRESPSVLYGSIYEKVLVRRWKK